MSTKLFSFQLTQDQVILLNSILEEHWRRCGAGYELRKLVKGYGCLSDYLKEIEPIQTLMTELNIQYGVFKSSDSDGNKSVSNP